MNLFHLVFPVLVLGGAALGMRFASSGGWGLAVWGILGAILGAALALGLRFLAIFLFLYTQKPRVKHGSDDPDNGAA